MVQGVASTNKFIISSKIVIRALEVGVTGIGYVCGVRVIEKLAERKVDRKGQEGSLRGVTED